MTGGELPLSLKDEVFKTQGIKNSSSFLSVPPLPPHAPAAPNAPAAPHLPILGMIGKLDWKAKSPKMLAYLPILRMIRKLDWKAKSTFSPLRGKRC